MQVNDATVPPGVAGARKDDHTADAADAARKGSRSGGRFRETLRRPGAGDPGAETGTALAAALAGWFRAEPGPRSPAPPPPIAPAPAPASKIDRILIGDIGGDVEARIRIGSGALAGAEIRLSSAPGSRAVAAEVLTGSDGSRQTLSVVMDELRQRLRGKGILLAGRPRAADGRAARRSNDGDGGKPSGGSGR